MSNLRNKKYVHPSKRPVRKHFVFEYSVEELAKSTVPFKQHARGDVEAIQGWCGNATAYWSFTAECHGYDKKTFETSTKNANWRSPVPCSPHDLLEHKKAAIEAVQDNFPRFEWVGTIVKITMSLVKPVSKYQGMLV